MKKYYSVLLIDLNAVVSREPTVGFLNNPLVQSTFVTSYFNPIVPGVKLFVLPINRESLIGMTLFFGRAFFARPMNRQSGLDIVFLYECVFGKEESL